MVGEASHLPGLRVRKVLLSTHLFAVEQRVHERPGGDSVSREVVVHPDGVAVLPIIDHRHIVMVRDYRYAGKIGDTRRTLFDEGLVDGKTIAVLVPCFTSSATIRAAGCSPLREASRVSPRGRPRRLKPAAQ